MDINDFEIELASIEEVIMTDLDDEAQYDDTNEIRISSTSSIDQLVNEAAVRNFCKNSKTIRAITLHHTYSPNASQYKGRSTILGIKKYHMQSVGASDIMANFYTSPVDNYIGWTGRSLSVKNGAHAHISKPWNSVPSDLKTRANGNTQYLNYYSVGIETIGNLDSENPKNSKAMKNSIKLMAILCDIYKLDIEKDLYFHRDVAYKSCPGNLVTKEWVKQEVKKQMANENKPDVSSWAIEAVNWAKKEGIITGYTNGKFGGTDPVTREQLAVILKRFHDKFIK